MELYLDANATTPVLPAARDAAMAAMADLYGNPSSVHSTGLKAKAVMETARERASRVLGVGDGKILFTSGATEGIQTAVLSALVDVRNRQTRGESTGTTLLYGATEHSAIPTSLRHWNQVLGLNLEVTPIPVDQNGRHDLQFLRQHLPSAALLCTMAANNETGVITDLASVESLLKEVSPETLWLVDCVQALGKLNFRMTDLRIDYAPFSGHKLYAPKGIGMLYVRHGAPFTPLITGGGQEAGWRCGTENMVGIAALSAVLDALENGQFQPVEKLKEHREKIASALREVFPGLVFNTPFELAVPTTINFSVPGFASNELLNVFDAASIRVSSGSACSSKKAAPSFVLQAMGLPEWRLTAAVRASFGPAMTDDECAAICARIHQCGDALRSNCLIIDEHAVLDENSPTLSKDGLIQLNSDGACTYILADHASRQCIVIDPVAELAERLEKYISCQNYQVLAILDTHGHADHESIRPALQRKLADRLVVHKATNSLGWPDDSATLSSVTLADGERVPALKLGQNVLARTALPGHTADSVAYLFGTIDSGNRLAPDSVRQVFAGDTILMGSLGRTNFSNSSSASMHASLRRLPSIIGRQTLICPAHDYQNEFVTTLATETRIQPLLSQALNPSADMTQEKFCEAKARFDGSIDDKQGCTLMCGASAVAAKPDNSVFCTPDTLNSLLNRQPPALLVDVRETHEHILTRDTLPPNTINVPLSRLAGKLGEWLVHQEQPLIFFCRSGNRSAFAARSLRRLGRTNVWSLSGLGEQVGALPNEAAQKIASAKQVKR